MPQLQVQTSEKTGDYDAAARALAAGLRAKFDTGDTRRYRWRLRQLEGIERFIEERETELLEALRADLGKSPTEGWVSELGFVLAEVRFAKKRLIRWMKPERVRTAPAMMPGRSFIYREPLGVVLVISPWNYPFHLLMAPVVGAVAAGNCVLLKPSEIAPHTSAVIARFVPEYVDGGAVKVMEGGVAETTALLAQRWDHIFYTGNGTVGRIVMAAAAEHLTPVTLELGGKSPCIVDRTANLDVAARRIVFGKFYNAGQTCVAPDHVLVEDMVHDALINRLVSTIREFYGDDPKATPDFGRIINERHHARLTKLLSSGETVVGGQSDASERYIAPTILRDVKPTDPVMQEEIFGPILPVISVPTVDAAIAHVNRGDKPLALYVFSRDRRTQEHVIKNTSAGGTTVNHVWFHLGVPDLPFGGVGNSGMGAYHGRHSFETFSHQRGVLKKGFRIDPALGYPPYTASKLRWIKKLT